MRRMKRLYILSGLLALGAASWLFAQGGPEEIRLTVGKSIVIDYPADIARISTSNPDIVDASPVTGREVLVHGKSFGTVTLVVWSKAGQRNFYNITVEQNLEPLRQLLKETFPAQDIHVQSSRDSLSLTGRVANKDIGDRATALATPFAKTVVNNLQVAEPPVEKQILLRIKFAELDRSAANSVRGQPDFHRRHQHHRAPSPPASSRPLLPPVFGGGSTSYLLDYQCPEYFRVSSRSEPGRADPGAGATQHCCRPWTSRPWSPAMAKKPASWWAANFPSRSCREERIPAPSRFSFENIGVRLTFTPIITGNNNIRLHVKPEVSALDYTNALSFNGFTIPALSSRKMETNIELGEGQSFVIAGLIDNQVTETHRPRFPVLSSLPILGNLFKSKEFDSNDTELIVMVTPEITMPLQPGDAKPSACDAAALPGAGDARVRAMHSQRKGKAK